MFRKNIESALGAIFAQILQAGQQAGAGKRNVVPPIGLNRIGGILIPVADNKRAADIRQSQMVADRQSLQPLPCLLRPLIRDRNPQAPIPLNHNVKIFERERVIGTKLRLGRPEGERKNRLLTAPTIGQEIMVGKEPRRGNQATIGGPLRLI